MQDTLFEIDLELLLRQERYDAWCHEVDERLRVCVLLVLERPFALRYDKAKDFNLALGVFITISGCLPIAGNAFEQDWLVPSNFLWDIFKYGYKDSEQAHIFSSLVDDILTSKDRLLAPIVGDVSQEQITCPLVDLAFLSKPRHQFFIFDSKLAHELD